MSELRRGSTAKRLGASDDLDASARSGAGTVDRRPAIRLEEAGQPGSGGR